MTAVYMTIDTEYSARLATRLGLHARQEVFERSITCVTDFGDVGIGYQMDVMEEYGMKGSSSSIQCRHLFGARQPSQPWSSRS